MIYPHYSEAGKSARFRENFSFSKGSIKVEISIVYHYHKHKLHTKMGGSKPYFAKVNATHPNIGIAVPICTMCIIS